ncbi:MAG TPA: hypothetical protein VKO45_06995 [Methanomicrobiales archaeon]|nr:hypothetical protein [Methanomicrobiales archaeon]
MKENYRFALLLFLTSGIALAAILFMILLSTRPTLEARVPADITAGVIAISLFFAGATVLQPLYLFYRLDRQKHGVPDRGFPGQSGPIPGAGSVAGGLGLVPHYLSFAPTFTRSGYFPADERDKPWVVNLLFTGDPLDFDSNGLSATILDLQRRGFLELMPGERGEIHSRVTLSEPGNLYESVELSSLLDPYEVQVLGFFRMAEDEERTKPGNKPPGAEGAAWPSPPIRRLSPKGLYPPSGLFPAGDLLKAVSSRHFTDGRPGIVPFVLAAALLYTLLLFALAWPWAPIIVIPVGLIISIVWMGAYAITKGFATAHPLPTPAERARWILFWTFFIVWGISLPFLMAPSVRGDLSVFLDPMFWFIVALLVLISLVLTAGYLFLADPGSDRPFFMIVALLLLLGGLILTVSVPDPRLLLATFISALSLALLFRSVIQKRAGMAFLSTILISVAGIPAVATLLARDIGGMAPVSPVANNLTVNFAFACVVALFLTAQYFLFRGHFLQELREYDPKKQTNPGTEAMFCFVLFLALFFFLQVYQSGIVLLVLALLVVFQYLTALSFPSTLFGRWSRENERKKQEWDAFRNMLSDFAMIRQYAPEDLAMWGEWLVYGTALGAGENVERVMKERGIEIPGWVLPPDVPLPPELTANFRLARWWNRFSG